MPNEQMTRHEQELEAIRDELLELMNRRGISQAEALVILGELVAEVAGWG